MQDLVHRVDHRAGGADLAEPIADVDDLTEARILPAELGGKHDGEQALVPERIERLARKPRVAIDGVGELGGDGGDRLGAPGVIAAGLGCPQRRQHFARDGIVRSRPGRQCPGQAYRG